MADGKSAAVCVTGMHRSGTSFAARSLELFGVNFGDPTQLMGPGPDNASGYWENRFMKELDDELLAHLGGSWDSPPVLAPGWERDASVAEFRTRGTALLEGAFGRPEERAPLVAFKDPRLCLLLPFWRTLVPVTATVVMIRDPMEVAASLETRNGIGMNQACLLWLRYTLSVATMDDGALLLRHEDFFEALPQTLARLASQLQLAPPDDALIRAAREQVDPALRHHVATPRPADQSPIVELTMAIWNEGTITFDVLDPLVTRAIAEGWLRAPTDAAALDAARAKVVELTERLRKRARQRAAAARATDER